jgi:aminoglycoside/choline kinase family phosphotransferase
VLLEDFGDRRMREHLDDHPEDEAEIYRAAIDTIVRLAGTPAAHAQPYDMATYLREVQLLTEWYMPAMGLPFDANAFDQMWVDALAPLASCQDVTVLRDYHAETSCCLMTGNRASLIFKMRWWGILHMIWYHCCKTRGAMSAQSLRQTCWHII